MGIYITFQNTDAFKENANGVYKLIPYYQRIYPQNNPHESSRFIIQKHPFSGEWQLTEIYNYIYRKTIHSFSKEEENPMREQIIAQVLVTLQKMLAEKDHTISNIQQKLKFLNHLFEEYKNQNNSDEQEECDNQESNFIADENNIQNFSSSCDGISTIDISSPEK